MWFSLFAVVLVLTVTFYQGLQGLFTAMITCVLTVLSAALAFGLYEDIYFQYLADRQPEYGRAIALMAIFLVSLLVLRTIFDMLIKGNMQFPVYVDRAGGGLFGFVTAMIVIGMLTIGFQLLPFPSTFLGFSRYTAVSKETGKELAEGDELANADFSTVRQQRHSAWLEPGGFTVSLVSHLSGNALQGRNRLADTCPDVLAAAHWARGNPLGRSRLVVEKDSLTVQGYWDMPVNEFYMRKAGTDKDKKTIQLVAMREPPDAGMKRIVIRVKLDDKAKDSDGAHRFVPEQFRLMVPDARTGGMRECCLVGLSNEKYPNRIVQVFSGEGITRQNDKGPTVLDLAFAVPEDTKFGPGSFLEYKQNARAEITPSLDLNKKRPAPLGGGAKPKPDKSTKTEKPAPEPREEPSPQSSNGQGTGNEGGTNAQEGGITPPKTGGSPASPNVNRSTYGRVSGLGPAREMVLSDKLPWPSLTNYGGQAEIAGGIIKGAQHMVAELDGDFNPKKGTQQPAERFEVPQNKRLVQVSVEKLQAGSFLGQAKGYAIDNVSDFYLIDESGNQIRPAGVFAIARSGNRNIFELIYLNEAERDMVHLPKFERVKRADLQNDYVLVYLFLVPPGTKPKAVHTGGRNVDLSQFNFVAQ